MELRFRGELFLLAASSRMGDRRSRMIGTLLGERESLNFGSLGPGLGVRGPVLIRLRSAIKEGEGDRRGEPWDSPVYTAPLSAAGEKGLSAGGASGLGARSREAGLRAAGRGFRGEGERLFSLPGLGPASSSSGLG